MSSLDLPKQPHGRKGGIGDAVALAFARDLARARRAALHVDILAMFDRVRAALPRGLSRRNNGR